MAKYVRVNDGVAVNMELVTRVELRGSDVLLYSGQGHVHSVHYDNADAAQTALDDLTETALAARDDAVVRAAS